MNFESLVGRINLIQDVLQAQSTPIGVTLWLADGRLRQFDDVDSLLPFSFRF